MYLRGSTARLRSLSHCTVNVSVSFWSVTVVRWSSHQLCSEPNTIDITYHHIGYLCLSLSLSHILSLSHTLFLSLCLRFSFSLSRFISLSVSVSLSLHLYICISGLMMVKIYLFEFEPSKNIHMRINKPWSVMQSHDALECVCVCVCVCWGWLHVFLISTARLTWVGQKKQAKMKK